MEILFFQQTIGIPMGTDCAPYLANLFLFSYEFDFLNSTLKQKDFATLYKFNKCYRYIDDLLAINNDGVLEDFKHTIYPPELQLNCEDKNDQEVNYLDLSLNIKNSSIQYKLYDKRDKFGFRIVNFPDLRVISQPDSPMEFLYLNWCVMLVAVNSLYTLKKEHYI